MSSANSGECITTGCLYRPTHLCVAHFKLHKILDCFFCDVVRFGVCMGLQRGAGFEFRSLTALGEKAVEQSGGAGSDAPEPSS